MNEQFAFNNEMILKFLKHKELLEINSKIDVCSLMEEDDEYEFDKDLKNIEKNLNQRSIVKIPEVFEQTVKSSKIIVEIKDKTMVLIKESQNSVFYECLCLYSKGKNIREIADVLCTTPKNASRILLKSKKCFLDYFSLFSKDFYVTKFETESKTVLECITNIKTVIKSVLQSSDERVVAVYDNIYEDFTTSDKEECSLYPSAVDYELLSSKSKNNLKTIEENSIYLKYIRQAVILFINHNRCTRKSKFIATEIFLNSNASTEKMIRKRYTKEQFNTTYRVAFQQTMTILDYVFNGISAICRSVYDNNSMLYIVEEGEK